uniref:Uncharacterized protein n=1 Tax=Trichogramma kaykai TaxID=54128 RepID=A0ABD2WKV0_9HYME
MSRWAVKSQKHKYKVVERKGTFDYVPGTLWRVNPTVKLTAEKFNEDHNAIHLNSHIVNEDEELRKAKFKEETHDEESEVVLRKNASGNIVFSAPPRTNVANEQQVANRVR